MNDIFTTLLKPFRKSKSNESVTNLFVRLFIVLSKLSIADKMKLDQFTEHGERLDYNISVDGYNLTPSTHFSLHVDIDKILYSFTHDDINEERFDVFEQDLSRFLNILFERKQAFDQNHEVLENITGKLNDLTTEERQHLAMYIDSSPETILGILDGTEKN